MKPRRPSDQQLRTGNASTEPPTERLDGQRYSGNVIDPEHRTQKVPWWRRSSPWWLLVAIPFTSMASSAKLAPRIEIYTHLVCADLKPDAFGGQDVLNNFGLYYPSSFQPSNFSVSTAFHTDHTSLDPFIESSRESTTPNPFNPDACASDPVVQAAVAKLIAVVALCSGVLSFITTGYWGSFSDRHGRAPVMGISVLGLLLDDLTFILVANFPRLFPGGYWFLVVGATIEGCLGGFTTGVAAIHTYMTDTTNEHDRSRILSLNVGLLFTGMAVGPTLGSFLIRATGQALSVFYAAVICTLLYSFLVWVILPESVTEQQMIRARKKYNELDLLQASNERERGSPWGLPSRVRWVSSILSPLTIFLPVSVKSSNGIARRDWSLMLLGLAYGCTISIMGSYSNKLQYAAFEFGWSTEMIGYFLSFIGATRAIVMTLILPVSIKFFKRNQRPIAPVSLSDLPAEETPLLESLADDPQTGAPIRRENFRGKLDAAAFDLRLAKFSLVADIITYFGLAIARTGRQFTACSIFGAFGMGFNPAMQSATLALYTRRGGMESGRLFGALSVIHAFSTQILGPTLYSFVYARTVATFPRAIFFVTLVAAVISFFLLLLVRLPENLPVSETSGNAEELVAETDS